MTTVGAGGGPGGATPGPVEEVEAVEVVAAVGPVAAVEALGSETCLYVIRMGARAGRTCGSFHTERRCIARLDDTWRAEFVDDVERPRWAQLLQTGVAIFDLDFDPIISAMYALSFSAEGDCYCASCTPPGTAPAEALHGFTLDSGASRCFFRDSTTITPLPVPVPVRLADPSGGPVVASSSTVLPCPAVPSGSLSGLHLPSFSTNLESTAVLQDAMVTTTTPGGQRVSICTCTRTGRHLATTTLAALGFAPSTTDPSLFLRTDTSLPLFYVLVYVDDLVFATADTEALTLVKSELQKRHTCTDLGELRSYLGLQITRDRARRTITLTQSHMVHQVLQRFGFQYSSPQLTPLSTSHSLSAPPSDESIELSGSYPELVGCLIALGCCKEGTVLPVCSTSGMGLVLGGRGPVVLTGHADASWRSTCSSSVLSSSCEAEIYAGAMAAQELRWLTYMLTDLGEQPRSPPVLYVDNKAMIALCQEHRLEHRTKHIALRYFLAQELQQCG
ncbi:unnamed protein product [Closterium sp. NIES-53]